MLSNLLIYRFCIFNVLCAVVLGWAYTQGYVLDMFSKDASYMTYVAVVLFAIGTASCTARVLKISRLLNRNKITNRQFNELYPSAPISGPKLIEKHAHLDMLGDLILTVGLTGTAIGIVMMLNSFAGGINAESASQVVDAMGTAFRSTIVSAFAWMWHEVNVRMLKTATVILVEDASA